MVLNPQKLHILVHLHLVELLKCVSLQELLPEVDEPDAIVAKILAQLVGGHFGWKILTDVVNFRLVLGDDGGEVQFEVSTVGEEVEGKFISSFVYQQFAHHFLHF